ncbi:MAG: DnaJ C-terminal domain-containing protein [Candidatus Woesebacteria bacterium]|nr:DnaJ C-terminal domain-containing protein [Candidatus Woesebacteria bacterium]
MTTKNDFYDILGLSKSASSAEIKAAYRKKALEWHPDRHQGTDKEEAERKFKEINEAYQVLSDSSKKSAYDQYGHDAFAPGGRGAAGNPFAGFGGQNGQTSYTWSSGGGQNPFGNMDFGDPFDIFESFFGGGSPFRQQRQVPRYSVKIDFLEAVKGVTKEFSIEGKKRKIKIPAGVDEGTRINFGDFMLSINVTPHEFFERDGDDIYINVTIPYSMAVMGGTIEVPTIDTKVKLKVRNGTQSGTMIRLRGKGAPNPNHRAFGDQYVKINILVPEKLTREQKSLIEEMKEESL